MPETAALQQDKYVIGIQTRTSNKQEVDPATSRIGELWKRFYRENLLSQIPNKLPSSAVCAVYTDYESDHTGEYTLTIGCEVSRLEEVPDGMVGLTIPAAKYVLFPIGGPEPKAVQAAWRQVWSHFPGTSAEKRAYAVDFEEFRFGPAGELNEAAIYISVGGDSV